MKCRLLMFLALLSFAPISFAGSMAGWGYITQVVMPADGSHIRVSFSEAVKNPEGCGAGGYYIRELDDSDGSTRFVSMIMMAYATFDRVNFWVEGCSVYNIQGATRPAIQSILVQHPSSN